jgi:hypothetical protein
MTEWTEDQLIEGVSAGLRRSVEGLFDAGLWLSRAKVVITPGDPWRTWLAGHFGISESYAHKLMALAGSKVLASVSHEKLPQDANVLYQLSVIDEDKLQEEIDAGLVRRGMSRDEARDLAVKHGAAKPREPAEAPTRKQLEHELDRAHQALDDLRESREDFELPSTAPAYLLHLLIRSLDKARLADLNTRLTEWLEKEDIPKA